MLLSEVQTQVKRQFGDTSGAMITDADITRWVNDAQLDIVRRTKIAETTTVMASVIATGTYTIADVFEIKRLTYNGEALKKITTAQLDQQFPTREVSGYGYSTPRYWRNTGIGVELFPRPADSLGTISVTYTLRPSPVVSSDDPLSISVQYHEDVVRRCMERAYEMDGQWGAASNMHTDIKDRTNEAFHDQAAGGGDSYPAVRCLPGDNGDVY